MIEWVKVYDLAEDHDTIQMGQQATLNSEFFGLVPEVALFGSDEWWQAIKSGRIPHHELQGVISRVYMSGHDDWPEFEVAASGKKSQWTRLGPDDLYREGNEVKVEYVVQRPKRNWGSHEVKQLLRIYIRPTTGSQPISPPSTD